MMVDVYKPHISGITNYISLNKEYLEKAGQVAPHRRWLGYLIHKLVEKLHS